MLRVQSKVIYIFISTCGMDLIILRTKHTTARVSYDGSFATDIRKQEQLPEKVLLQLTHSSSVVEVSEVPDSSNLQVTGTTLIHDRGPKQNTNGSPWVGSVEGVSDVKQIYAGGTIIISPYQSEENCNQGTARTPGGVISLKRLAQQLEIGVVSTSVVQLAWPEQLPVQKKRKVKHRESPVVTSAPQHELANVINQFGDGIEMDISTS